MSENEYEVEILNADQNSITKVPGNEYILDALEDAGHDLPHSCRQGMCTSCVARVIDGELDREGSALEPDQKEEFALICSAYPKTDLQIETDVQDELYGDDTLTVGDL